MSDTETERAWLERELGELREREARTRERLGQQAAVTARLRAYAETLHQLFRRRPPLRSHLPATLSDVARLSAQALGIQRTSVWCFDDAREHLRCVVQFVDDVEVPTAGVSIASAQCPAYVRAIGEESALAVRDVYDDPRTLELVEYLRSHGIGALLDIPIVVPGSLLGVVCHEFVGGPRVWEPSEIEFASNVGHLVALSLETERRVAAEYAARGSEAKYQYLVESLPVTVYSFDARSGRLEYVSPRASDLGGVSAQTWLAAGADGWVAQIHPDDRAPVLLRFQLGASGGFPEEITYRVLQPGGVRWVRDTCRVVRDHAGRPVAIQGILADVTAQHEAERSRIEFERRYRTLLENVDVIAVALDTEGRITFANDAFVRVSGYERERLLGADWFETVMPAATRDAARRRFVDDLRRGVLTSRFELGIVTRGGEARQLLCSNTLLRTADGSPEGTSSLALDVTDRRRLESELLQQTKLESLGRLAAGVAHDFNNLLMVMSAQVSMLKHDWAGNGSAQPAARFAAIDQAVEQASELSRSLLLYGRKQPPRVETLAVDALVREALPLLEAVVGHGVQLVTSLHAEGARVRLDRSRLRQALVNLVGNASDATVGHGKSVRVATHVELVDEAFARARGAAGGGEFVVVTVADDGRGMDERTLGSIFDPFFTTKADGRGTGLGLAITQTVVSQAGGFVTVESAPGAGTTFRVHLPTRDGAPRISTIPAPTPAGSATRVLVVEDMAPVRELVVGALRGAGYDVLAVPDCRSATEVLGSSAVQVLVTDLSLPDGSGAVLARSVRSARPEVRILVMSGSAEIDESFDGALHKPFDAQTLLAAVRLALEAAVT